MANAAPKVTAPKADQPRATTESVKQTQSPPSLTYRSTGIKNATGRSQRDYTRR